MTELLQKPGFLGTAARWVSDITLLLMIVVGLALTVGVILARQGKFVGHRWVQTSAVALNLILVISLMLSPYQAYVVPGIPQQINEPFFFVAILHGIVGFFAVVLGTFIVLRANGLMIDALKFSNYKRFMRTSYGLYMLNIFLGVLVYYFWYIN